MAEYQKNISPKDEKKLGGRDYAGVEQPDVDYDNFYSGVMNPRDVVANILRNLKDPNVSGVAYKMYDDKLVLTVNVYEFPSDAVLKDMIGTMNEVIKFLKKRYKGETGKTLKLKKLADIYDVVGAYTTSQKAKIAYHITFEIGKNELDAKTNTLHREIGYDDDRKPDFKVA